MTKEPLLTMRAVAVRLDMSLSAAYGLVARGDLPAIRIGSGRRPRLRVEPADLDAYLVRQRRGETAAARRDPDEVVDPDRVFY